jgi:hypothetical protein
MYVYPPALCLLKHTEGNDRPLTFHQHIQALFKKIKSHPKIRPHIYCFRKDFLGGMQMNNQYQLYIDQILSTWPEKQREGALKIITKYGFPQEATVSRLIWYNNGPWKRTIVYRDAFPHVL